MTPGGGNKDLTVKVVGKILSKHTHKRKEWVL